MTKSPIIKTQYPFDRQSLKKLYQSVCHQVAGYGDTQHGIVNDWSIVKVDNDDYINQIKFDLKIPTAKPRFYILKAHSSLPEHVDLNTKCSINVILSETAVAPIIIEGVKFSYSQCLLNTQRRHYVVNGPEDRLLFKLSIFDQEFEDVYQNILPYVEREM
jgi:hypothetical protein